MPALDGSIGNRPSKPDCDWPLGQPEPRPEVPSNQPALPSTVPLLRGSGELSLATYAELPASKAQTMSHISESGKEIGGDSHGARRLGCEPVSQPARWPCSFPIGCSPARGSFLPQHRPLTGRSSSDSDREFAGRTRRHGATCDLDEAKGHVSSESTWLGLLGSSRI